MAGGTGNLILKRGTTIPESALLPKAMPAVQLVNISPVNTTGGTPEYAYVNFPNRLWIGMEGLTCGSGGFSGYETGSGSSGGGNLGSILPCDQLGTQDLNRPLWMGAEIRAFEEVYEDVGDTVPIILKADWTNPSDVIVVTQKAIHQYIQDSVVKGNNSTVVLVETVDVTGDTITIQAPGDVTTSYTLTLPTALPSTSPAGKTLKIDSVNTDVATLVWGDPGAASVASTVELTPTDTDNGSYYVTFVSSGTGVASAVRTDTNLVYNPSTNTLTATTFSGNATTATSATSATTATTATNANNINISAITSTDTATSIVLVGAQSTGNQPPFIDSGLAYNANTDVLVVGGATTGGVTTGVVTTTQITRSNNTIEINAGGGSGTVIRGSQTGVGTTDTRPVLTVMPETQGGSNDQFVKIEGGDLYLGNKTITDAGASSAVNIIFDGATTTGAINRTTLTVVDPTQANTITLPNTSGTVAIVAGDTTEVQFNNSGVLDSSPNFTFTKSGNGTLNLAGTLALNGGSMTTSAANVNLFTGMTSGNITVGGAGSTTVIGGNLTVSGTTTTVNAETVTIDDNTIVLNNNEASTPTLNAGIEVERGTSSNVSLLWSEGSDKWSTTRVNADVAVYPNTFHPIVVADSNSTLHSTGSEGSAASGTVTFNGTISGTSLTASSVNGKLTPGMYIFGSSVTAGTSIVSQSSGTANGDGVYVVSTAHAILVSQAFTAESGRLGNQYIHTASVKYLDATNLNISGNWTITGTVTNNFNLSNGGILLPYLTGTYHTANAMSSLPEGQIAYDTATDRVVYNRGDSATSGQDASGNTLAVVVDESASQTLSNKTLTAPKIVNNGFIADANGNEQIVFVTTSSAVNEITITNAATGGSPLIASSGGDTNIDLKLQGKGSGTVVIDDSAINTSNGTFSVFNSTASNISAFGAATTLSIGSGSTGTATINNTTVTAPNATSILGVAATTVSLSTTATAAPTINIGTGNHSSGTKTINIGTGNNSNSTTTAVTIGSGTATTGASCSVFLGCPNAATTNVYVQSNRLVFGTTTSNRPVLSGAATTSATVVHTLPDVNSGNVVIAGTTNFNTSNYILMGGGSTTPSAFTDKDTVVVGGVRVNFQNSTPTNTRYPIPFLGSDRQTNTTAPATFGTTTDGTYADSYLYANLGAATATGTVTNYTTGLFYEVNDSVGTGVGTLFCDYIGATLDCGTYT